MNQVPAEVRLTQAWKNLSEEFEAFILRDLTGALEPPRLGSLPESHGCNDIGPRL